MFHFNTNVNQEDSVEELKDNVEVGRESIDCQDY